MSRVTMMLRKVTAAHDIDALTAESVEVATKK